MKFHAVDDSIFKMSNKFYDDFMNCLIFNGSLTVRLLLQFFLFFLLFFPSFMSLKTLAFKKKARRINEWMVKREVGGGGGLYGKGKLTFFIHPLSRLTRWAKKNNEVDFLIQLGYKINFPHFSRCPLFEQYTQFFFNKTSPLFVSLTQEG